MILFFDLNNPLMREHKKSTIPNTALISAIIINEKKVVIFAVFLCFSLYSFTLSINPVMIRVLTLLIMPLPKNPLIFINLSIIPHKKRSGKEDFSLQPVYELVGESVGTLQFDSFFFKKRVKL